MDPNLQDLQSNRQCIVVDRTLADRYGWTAPVAVPSTLADNQQLIEQLVIEGAEAAKHSGELAYAKLTLNDQTFWIRSMEGSDKVPYVLIYSA